MRAACQPTWLDTPTYRARPDSTAQTSALTVSSMGVCSSQVWASHTSTWSVRSRRSEVSSWCISARREQSTTRLPVDRLMPDLVTSTTSSRSGPSRRSPSRSSAAPPAYPCAVSTRVPPAERKAVSRSRASSGEVRVPHAIVPRPSRETARPEVPRRRVSMAATLSPDPSLPWAPCGWRSPAVTRAWDSERTRSTSCWRRSASATCRRGWRRPTGPTHRRCSPGWRDRPRRSGWGPVSCRSRRARRR